VIHVKRSFKVVAGSAVVGLVAAGGAFAYWTADGTGTGSVTTDTTQALTVIQTVDTTKLTPGGPAIALHGMVLNPNAGIHINGITATVGNMPGTGCDPAWFTVTGPAPAMDLVFNNDPTLNRLNLWSGITIGLRNEPVNQDGCKGLAVPIVYTVN
jgi:hypothetical protein